MINLTDIIKNQIGPQRARPDSLAISLVLYGLAAVTNVWFGYLMRYGSTPATLEDDELEYFQLAQQFLDGNVAIDGRRTMGFPLLLSLMMRFAHSFTWLQIHVSLFYSLAIPLFYLALLRITGSWRAGLASALLLVFWPPALMYSNSLYSESAAMPFLMLLLILLPPQREESGKPKSVKWPGFLAAGMMVGVLTHIRPMYLLILPFVFLVITIECKALRLSALRILVTAIGFLTVILPWSAYVTHVTGSPILVTASAGETLAGGLNPNLISLEGTSEVKLADRTTWQGPGKWITPNMTGFLTEAEAKLPYTQVSKLLSERCIEWIKGNPGKAIYLEFRKLTYMWGIYPGTANGMTQFLLGNIPILLLLAWAGYCITHTPVLASRYVRFLAMPVFVSCVALISWGSWRFRLPGDVGLIAFCMTATVKIWRDRLASGEKLNRLMQFIKDTLGTAKPGQG